MIGPAVNEASRIQDLTKELRQPILASGEFADALGAGIDGRPLQVVGTRSIRGVAQPVELYAPIRRALLPHAAKCVLSRARD